MRHFQIFIMFTCASPPSSSWISSGGSSPRYPIKYEDKWQMKTQENGQNSLDQMKLHICCHFHVAIQTYWYLWWTFFFCHCVTSDALPAGFIPHLFIFFSFMKTLLLPLVHTNYYDDDNNKQLLSPSWFMIWYLADVLGQISWYFTKTKYHDNPAWPAELHKQGLRNLLPKV